MRKEQIITTTNNNQMEEKGMKQRFIHFKRKFVPALSGAIMGVMLMSTTCFAAGVVSLKRLLNQSNLKSWSSKMIKKSLEAYFFTLKNKIVFCKKQFQNMSVFCFVSTEIV